MPFKKYTSMRPRPVSFAAKAISFLFALSMFALSSVHAAGLGKLTVLSSLGQPLRAEIELTAVTPDEAGTIVVKLASHEAYRKANLDFTSVQQSLRFAVDKRGNRHFVRVTSTQPLNEPFLGMLLELRSINSQLTREYTFLLDPADLRSSAPAVAATPVRKPEPVPAPVAQAEPAKPAAPAVDQEPMDQKVQRIQKQAKALKSAAKPEEKPAAPEPEKKAAVKEKAEAAEYKIKKGDSLAVIAKKHRHDEVTLEQMMVSIYQTNPNAFDGKNMNRLRVGRVLTVPDAETAGGVTKAEARKVIVAQAADFATYRQKLAAQVELAAAQKQAEAAQAAGGQVTAKVEDKQAPAQDAQDKLKLSKAGAKGKSGAGTGTAEDKAAREKEIADKQARVKELEKNVSDLQRTLESQKLKAAQEAAAKKAAEEAAAKKAAEEAAAKKAAEAAAAKKAADDAAAAKKAADDAAAAKKAADEAAAQKAAADAAAAKQASVPAASVPAASVPAASVPAASVPAKPAVKRVAPPPPPPPPPSFFDELLDNPIMLGGIGVAVVLLIYVLIRVRGKKSAAPAAAAGATSGETRDAPNSLFGNSGGQSVDTNNSIFNSGFIPSASLLDANEVDPIAEADVYIAYGREGQAIEILKDALRTNPERNALRVKLLEIYASQKDVKAFDMLAGELYGITRGEGDEWVHVAGLGAAIDPANPLYAGGDAVTELDRPTSLQGSMTQPQPELDPVVRLETPRAQELAEPTPQQIESPDFALDLEAPAESKASVDFDLSAKESAAQEAAPLDFDLSAPAPAEAKPEQPEAKADTADSLDFDLGDFTAKKDDAAPDTSGLSVSEIPASELDQMLEFKPAAPAAEPQVAAVEAADSVPVLEEPVAPAETAPASSGFDFGAINLDLAPDATVDAPKPVAARTGSAEMDTKIELAAAYLGIGDKEGARELLEEVIQEGAPEQVERAREALSKIS